MSQSDRPAANPTSPSRRGVMQGAVAVAAAVGTLASQAAEAASYGDPVTWQSATTSDITGTQSMLAVMENHLQWQLSKLQTLRDDFDNKTVVGTADILIARGHSHTRLGHTDAAITDLNALVSVAQYAIPWHLTKLAQQLVRRAQGTDLADAVVICTSVLAGNITDDEEYFAYFVRAMARLRQGNYTASVSDADAALAIRADDRVEWLRTIASEGAP